jgi:hypothetical protein
MIAGMTAIGIRKDFSSSRGWVVFLGARAVDKIAGRDDEVRRRREAVELAAARILRTTSAEWTPWAVASAQGLDRRPQIGRMLTNQAKRLLKGPEGL